MGEKGGKAAGGGTINKDVPADIDESEDKPEGSRQAVCAVFSFRFVIFSISSF